MKIQIIAIFLCLMCFFASAPAQLPRPAHWSAGLGEGPLGRLEFRFEVTFMKIDVADIEARLAPVTAAALGEVVTSGRGKKKDIARAADLLLAADSLAFRMTFLRDGGSRQVPGGHAQEPRGLSQARDSSPRRNSNRSGKNSRPPWTAWARAGPRKGDQLLYRVDPGRSVDGICRRRRRRTHRRRPPGDHWARGIKGSFLARDSRFRKKIPCPPVAGMIRSTCRGRGLLSGPR